MDDPLLRLKYYQETGQADSAKLYEQYLRETGQMPADDSEGKPGLGSKVLGTIAATGRYIPGVEAAQATARAVVRGEGWKDLLNDGLTPTGIVGGIAKVVGSPAYRESLSEIRGAEDAAPKVATVPARVAGGLLAGLALPGGAIRQGATYGALAEALNSSPDVGVSERATDAAKGAAVGGAAGAGVGSVSFLARAVRNAPPGAVGNAAAEFLPANVKRGARAIKALSKPAPDVVKPRIRLTDASAPKAEGFIGSSIDNFADVIKANRREPLNITKDTPLDDALRQLLDRSRETLPRGETASALNLSDAEIGMGLVPDEHAMTLAQALEESLKHVQKGGTLRSAVNAAPRYAGRPMRTP